MTKYEYKFILQNTGSNTFKIIYLPLKTCYIPVKCNYLSCSIKKHNDYININFIESKSNCKNGSVTWKNIYKFKKNIIFYKFISGIHFCINVHICYNYYNFLFFYRSNVTKYKIIRKYIFNFILLFNTVRECLHANHKIQKSYINNINKIIDEISCLDCNKCKVLGTLQFEGLKACILKSNGKKLTKYQFIYLFLFYKKILRTLRYIYYLENNL